MHTYASTRIDDVGWLRARTSVGSCLAFITDPYLAKQDRCVAGKLIYLDGPVFTDGNIVKQFGKERWFSVANRVANGRHVFLEDSELQSLAKLAGVGRGSGVNSNLSEFDNIQSVEWAPPLSGMEGVDQIHGVLKEVVDFYEIDTSRLRITGGVALSKTLSGPLHDLDIVIPIHSLQQAQKIAIMQRPVGVAAVSEYGRRWPLRWRTSDGTVICPFFVYDGVEPACRDVILTGELIESEVTVVNASLGIMNSPVYFTSGVVDLLLFRTRIVRGELCDGARLRVRAPACRVSVPGGGELQACLVTDPYTQVEGFEKKFVPHG